MANTEARRGRPLSPHLSIHRWPITMAMSIAHRVTGVGLYLGTALLLWWLIALASGPAAYADVQWFLGTVIGRLVMIGFVWSLIHHALGGVRHFIWDLGRGFERGARHWLGWATIVGSAALTALVFILAWVL